jgi:hypothetical protein
VTTSCGARLDRFRPALFQAAVDAAAAVCPVAIRHRTDALTLVVEVHLLPALEPAGADRRTLAALAEYAIAEVVEAGTPSVRRPAAPLPEPPSSPVAA